MSDVFNFFPPTFNADMADTHDVKRVLQEAGWKRIGRGTFADVYEHKNHPDMVVKHGREGEEDGWPEYAQWLMNSRRRAHVPKIYDMVHINSKQYLASMEKLESAEGSLGTLGFQSICGVVTPNDRRIKRLPPTLKRVTKDIVRHFSDWRFDLHNNNIMQRKDGTLVITDPLWCCPK